MNRKLWIIVAAVALASCDAGNGKNDILGFMPGMKKADVHALADSHKWRCENDYPRKNFSRTEETCYTLSGQMRVVYATNMEGWPVSALTLGFDQEHRGQRVSLEAQAEEISAQYGKKPDVMTRDLGGDVYQVHWNLDNGNVLTLEVLNQLTLENQAIVKADEDAGQRVNPVPKF
jgi:hypothetical protein